MTDDERREFMRGRARTALLATTRGDGRSHVAPVWFGLDSDTLIFMTGEDTWKG
ncbi:MAG: pyridoxamine 5'-phosphate oxidase family protein [Rubrobacteraceae bacterium]